MQKIYILQSFSSLHFSEISGKIKISQILQWLYQVTNGYPRESRYASTYKDEVSMKILSRKAPVANTDTLRVASLKSSDRDRKSPNQH